MASLLTVGALDVALSAAAADEIPPRASPLTPPTPGAMHRWSGAHMADDWKSANITEAQAVAIAQRFDLIVVAPGEFDAFHIQMHAANPLLKTLVYMNGTYLNPGQAGRYTEDQFAHTTTGERIKQALKWGNYLMNVASPSWAASRAQLCTRLLASTHADGCYLDMVGPQALNADYGSGLPMNPATGKVWTTPDYLAATKVIADQVRAAAPGRPLAGNGLGDGVRYYAPRSSKPVLSYVDAGHAEIWLRNGRSSPATWPTVAAWQRNVDMLVDAGAAGTPVLTQTKVWTTATQPEKDQWHRFALASFLLGTGGNSWFTFTGGRLLDRATQDHPWDRVDVGNATGPYALDPGGAYVRSFTKGYAAVNPGTATVTVTLPPGLYTNLDGEMVTTEVLPPHTGQVFTLAAV